MQVFRDIQQQATKHASAITIGNFDGLHRGHKALIDLTLAAANKENLLATLVSFEPLPRQYFDPSSRVFRLQSTTDKLIQLRQWGLDQVALLRFNNFLARLPAEDFIQQVLVDQLHARHIFVGEDFRFGKDRRGDCEMLRIKAEKHGYQVQFMPAVCCHGQRVSSTRLRQALDGGDMFLAAELLGRPFSLSGRVVKGQQLGRKLGYPTANIPMHHRPCPVTGVFAIEAQIRMGEKPLAGVASIGTRPTVGGEQVVLETHLFDFSGNLYGQRIRVNLIEFIRAEAHFSSLEELTEKMRQDEQLARTILAEKNITHGI